MPTSRRADLSRVLPAVRCTARKRNGEPCRAMAARGAHVCRVHGGSAPQVKAAAKRRLDQASDALVQRLLAFALDGDVTDNVALQAIIAALDRAGLNVRQAMEIEVGVKPYEELMSSITGVAQITKAQHDAIMAGQLSPQRELQAPKPDPYYDDPSTPSPNGRPAFAVDDEIIDAEIVPIETQADLEAAMADVARVNRAAGALPKLRRSTRRKRR
jgi:hypothetical protein